MEVQLYVYDLSKGLARQFSRQFLGTHIDAVYHTAIVLDKIEYFFGAGVQTTYAGTTHHGQPMEVVNLGKTELPIAVILEYLESLKEIYTMESYDLFMHNCNNFSNDFAMFLVGKGIPAHITSLPQTVLNTPFGQMLQPQLDRAMRSVTQAPVNAPISPLASASKGPSKTMTQHAHLDLKLIRFRNSREKYVTFTKAPPLDKIVAKLGDHGKRSIVKDIADFLMAAHSAVPQESRLPSLPEFASWLRDALDQVPSDGHFAVYDLYRLALADIRVSAFFAEEQSNLTTVQLLKHVNELGGEAPYNLRIVTLHMGCNLFASKISSQVILTNTDLAAELVRLALAGLLDEEHANVRVAAASLAYNIVAANSRSRLEKSEDVLTEESQVELVAAVLEALQNEKDSKQSVLGLVLALGLLVFCAPVDGAVADICRAMDAASAVKEKEGLSDNDVIVKEVGRELLAKGI